MNLASGLVVNEIFGPTFQGEGPMIGTPCMFVRLGICNLACDWCDTKYTWDWSKYDPKKELHKMSADEILAKLEPYKNRVHHLVISGGEPLLQFQAKSKSETLYQIYETLTNWDWSVEVETAGTILPPISTLPTKINVSPKLYHSGNPRNLRYIPEVLRGFDYLHQQGKAEVCFKFVAQKESDLEEIQIDFVDALKLQAPIYVMPEGVLPGTIRRRSKVLAEGVIAREWKMTTRLHVLAFGNKRGT